MGVLSKPGRLKITEQGRSFGPNIARNLMWKEAGTESRERVNSGGKVSGCKSLLQSLWGLIGGLGILIWLGGFPTCASGAWAQLQHPVSFAGAQAATPSGLRPAASTATQGPNPQTTGSITGTVADPNGGPVSQASITLSRNGQTVRQVQTANNGQFSFAGVSPGPYQLSITASGFESQSVSVVLNPGQIYSAPRISLALGHVVTSITVTPSKAEVAQYQLQQEERQLVLGFVPNYMVTYYPHTAPLSARQKFQLTSKTVVNPFTIGLTSAFVGGEQATAMYRGYGTEEKNFAKRFGAAYGTLAVGAFMSDAVLPSILKQDPRFYYKGSGSVGSRLLYAITRSVICKGDNGHWQPDYSSVLGHFAAGGIANLYLPRQDRTGWGTTLENGMIGIGLNAVANILQEFLLPKLTPALSHRQFGRP